MSERELVDVAFVIEPEGSVLAVMPGVAADINHNNCACYAHIGQHGATCIEYIGENCRDASPTEYADLLDELRRVGYDVYVISPDRIKDSSYTEARLEQL
jgi:hypothetical protein